MSLHFQSLIKLRNDKVRWTFCRVEKYNVVERKKEIFCHLFRSFLTFSRMYKRQLPTLSVLFYAMRMPRIPKIDYHFFAIHTLPTIPLRIKKKQRQKTVNDYSRPNGIRRNFTFTICLCSIFAWENAKKNIRHTWWGRVAAGWRCGRRVGRKKRAMKEICRERKKKWRVKINEQAKIEKLFLFI